MEERNLSGGYVCNLWSRRCKIDAGISALGSPRLWIEQSHLSLMRSSGSMVHEVVGHSARRETICPSSARLPRSVRLEQFS